MRCRRRRPCVCRQQAGPAANERIAAPAPAPAPAGLVFVQPPAGLLDLGRQQALLGALRCAPGCSARAAAVPHGSAHTCLAASCNCQLSAPPARLPPDLPRDDAASRAPPARSADLEPFTHPPPLSVLARMGLRIMPSAAQLEAAGRADLVGAIRRAGGFLEVAQASAGSRGGKRVACALWGSLCCSPHAAAGRRGSAQCGWPPAAAPPRLQALQLRSQRKPAGYWHDEDNLGGWRPARAGRAVGAWRFAVRSSGSHLPPPSARTHPQPSHRPTCARPPLPATAPPPPRPRPAPAPPPDEELTLFVAAHWTRFHDPDSRQPYWYNQVGGRVDGGCRAPRGVRMWAEGRGQAVLAAGRGPAPLAPTVAAPAGLRCALSGTAGAAARPADHAPRELGGAAAAAARRDRRRGRLHPHGGG